MALRVGEAKVKLRTATLKAELEGSINGCIVDLLRFVRVRAEREKILQDMQALHLRMCEDEPGPAKADRSP
jgi:hypothetical protein